MGILNRIRRRDRADRLALAGSGKLDHDGDPASGVRLLIRAAAIRLAALVGADAAVSYLGELANELRGPGR